MLLQNWGRKNPHDFLQSIRVCVCVLVCVTNDVEIQIAHLAERAKAKKLERGRSRQTKIEHNFTGKSGSWIKTSRQREVQE